MDRSPGGARRPRRITALCVVTAVISGYHLLRFTRVLIDWRFLRAIPYRLPVLYLALDGFLWGTAGLVLVWALWSGRPWARPTGLLLAGLYAAARWADLIWAAAPELLPVRWPLAAAGTLIGLVSVAWILNSQASRDYFHR